MNVTKSAPSFRCFVIAIAIFMCAAFSKAWGKPNVIVVIADQWRTQSFGFAGDPNVKTPRLDHLAAESCWFTHAVSGLPVCSPMRATMLTGQRPLTHGVFINDVPLSPEAVSIGKVMHERGYDTAFVGKWHVDGHGRSIWIPRERRQGFDYWKVLECTHSYNHSPFYEDDDATKHVWKDYDAAAQTDDVCAYLKAHQSEAKPFLLFLAWGPPHNPYETAPERFKKMYDPATLKLRPNVPEAFQAQARKDLAGYYAHCSALDELMGRLLDTLRDTGLAQDTILMFTADHGDMLGSQGLQRKQKPYDESIRIPLLVRWPAGLGTQGKKLEAMFNSEDIMPTLLGLAGVDIPRTAEGLNYSAYLRGGADPGDGAALIQCPSPFGEWTRNRGGREYRGIRTSRYTYVRDLNGPWLLFDNETDPYQMKNLVGDPASQALQAELNEKLNKKLRDEKDEFKPGPDYIAKWNYKVDASGTMPYTN